MGLNNFLLFHTIAEFASVAVAFSVFILVWDTKRINPNPNMLILGVGYLFVALIDLLHLLSYQGMSIFPNNNSANIATQFWIAARAIETATFLLFAWFRSQRMQILVLVFFYALSTSLMIISIMVWPIFPACFIDGTGLTNFKIISEYVFCTLIAVAIMKLRSRKLGLEEHVLLMVRVAMSLTILAELLFTLYSDVYGLVNLAAHLVKTLSFALIYLVIVRNSLTRPFQSIFRQLEQQNQILRESDKKRLALLSNLPGVVYRCLYDDKWTMLFLSDGCFTLTGYHADELIQNKVVCYADIIHPDDRKMVENLVRDQLLQEKSYELEYRIIHKDGEIKTIWEKGCADKLNGEIIALDGFITDFSSRKQLEEKEKEAQKRLHQSQKLEALGTMIGGIAHELNNVFQSIFLFSGLVQDSLTKHSDADVNMSQILRDTERARDLIKQILHFSRKEEIRFGAYHLQDIVQDAIRFLHASLPVEIKLETQFEMNVPPVKCDRTQIHQIIINLCNNAHHAMPEGGGTITIKLTAEKLVKDSQSKPVPMVKLEISDTGHGMDQETLDRIFDPFFTTKELGKGTGLGLSVVYSIVENIGGTISATSIVGRGSTFTMLLPADIGQISEPDKTKTQFMPMVNQSWAILMVDDEASILEAVAKMLRAKGFVVEIADRATKAMELISARPIPYDLILTDQSMPDISGIDMIRSLRDRGDQTPVVLSSGILSTYDKQVMQELQITKYLQKPWTLDQLVTCLYDILADNHSA